MAEDKKSLETNAVMLVLSGEERNFDRKDVETAIELVKQELAAKEAEAQKRKEKQERVKKEAKKPKEEGTESSSDGNTEKNGATLLDEETRHLLERAPRLTEVITEMLGQVSTASRVGNSR